jgi:hypothetical protein
MAYYIYAPLDLLAQLMWMRWRSQAGGGGKDFIQASLGRQSYRAKYPVLLLFLTLRLVGMYHLSSEMSKKYLADNAAPILRKSNPRKEQLLDKMKEF